MGLFRTKLALALGSGGPKGLAHIGAIRALAEHPVPIDYIAGTSAGAIIGGMFAASGRIDLVEEYILEKNWLQTLSYFTDPGIRHGLFQGKKVREFLEGFLGNKTFSDVKIPFTAVAADLKMGHLAELRTGLLTDAILASCAIPMVFKPIQRESMILTDGAVISPVPVKTARSMGGGVVVAVNLYHTYDQDSVADTLNIIEVGRQSFNLMFHIISEIEIRQADVVINPSTKHIYWKSLLSKEDKKKGIEEGYRATLEHIPEIQVHLQKNKLARLFSKINIFHKR